MDTFQYTLNALLPILLIILLGYYVGHHSRWNDSFFKQLNQLCFHLFLPIQLFYSVSSISDLREMNWPIIGFLVVTIFACLGCGLAASKLFVKDRRQKSCIVQASFRSNTAILGLPLANALGGPEAGPFAALSTGLCVPVYNVLAVVILTLYSQAKDKKISPLNLLKRVITNPLIIGSVGGMIAVIIRGMLPTVDGQPIFTIQKNLTPVYTMLGTLSKIASPVMLFALGARLNLSAVKKLLPQISLGVFIRLIIAPLLAVGGAYLFRDALGLTVIEMPSLIAISASPVAVSSAVMVQEIGGDDQLANQLVVWTSVVSLFTVFAIVYLMRSIGML